MLQGLSGFPTRLTGFLISLCPKATKFPSTSTARSFQMWPWTDFHLLGLQLKASAAVFFSFYKFNFIVQR